MLKLYASVLALAGAADALTVTPKPQSVTVKELMGVSPQSFDFAATGANSGHLRDAFTRYYGILFTSTKSQWLDSQGTELELRSHAARGGHVSWETVTGMDVNVKLNDTTLSLETDESYTLTIEAPRASIEANSVYGAMHALESFSQLVERGSLVNGTTIVDKPRYAFRAVMIDTARHWYHKTVIFQHLDAMAYAKMNVLHWHLVDSDAFPFQSVTFPRMSQTGAYSPSHVYTHDDVKEVINYAAQRGIRVLPEFDTPGHVLKGWEDTGLLTECYDTEGTKTGTGPLNPTLNDTYTYLTSFYKEIHDLFPDKFVHVGGDEVPAECWQSNPQVTKWMKEQDPPLTSFADLETLYEQKLLDILKAQGTSYMVWQEIFGTIPCCPSPPKHKHNPLARENTGWSTYTMNSFNCLLICRQWRQDCKGHRDRRLERWQLAGMHEHIHTTVRILV